MGFKNMKIFNKNDLYKRTKWFSKDCENIVETLKKEGLSIVDTAKATELLDFQKRAEDDGK